MAAKQLCFWTGTRRPASAVRSIFSSIRVCSLRFSICLKLSVPAEPPCRKREQLVTIIRSGSSLPGTWPRWCIRPPWNCRAGRRRGQSQGFGPSGGTWTLWHYDRPTQSPGAHHGSGLAQRAGRSQRECDQVRRGGPTLPAGRRCLCGGVRGAFSSTILIHPPAKS
jgi:hypothetical protein